MYNISINNKQYQVSNDGGNLQVDDKAVDANIAQTSQSAYHIISNNTSYNVEVVAFNSAQKTAEIKVNGNTYQVKAKDQYDLLLEQLGLSSLKTGSVADLKAPMPGLVLKVFVNDGEAVQKGDNLLILEAMKMENIIKAPGDGTVKTIKIVPGAKVEKGQVLILFS